MLSLRTSAADRQPGAGRWPRRLGAAGRRVAVHLAVLAGYLAASIAVSWPRAAYLTRHVVPGTRDAGLFVWDLWWVARSVEHLSNPWFTRYQAAPVGAQLGFHTLMPLPGAVMTPVTIAFGPSFSYNLLSVVAPALVCYAMYRAARLYVPSQTGAIAAGAFFGLSTIMMWNAWWELNIALGAVFLPLALEAAVRLGRRQGSGAREGRDGGWGQAVILGVVLGAALLTDQESAIMAVILAAAALLPWLARRRSRSGARIRDKLGSVALAVAAFGVVASPQIIAMAQQALAGNTAASQHVLAVDYIQYAAAPGQIFAPSPRVAAFGLKGLAAYYFRAGQESLPITPYGVVLTALALFGLVVCWRRHGTRQLAVFWLGCTILALGTGIGTGAHARLVPFAQVWHGIRVSPLLPYTWMVRLPLLSSFREANRMLELGLVPLALLAAAGVDWLCHHARPVLPVVAILAVFEAGSAGAGLTPEVTMPTALPALTRPIAADLSGSIVVDIPYGVRGGLPVPGQGAPFDPEAQLQATAEGHPSAVGYISRLPESTLAATKRQLFYADLLDVQSEPRVITAELLGRARPGTVRLTGARRAAARRAAARLTAALRLDARRLDLGWAIIWPFVPGRDGRYNLAAIERYLTTAGFRFAYRADGALVYRLPSRALAAKVGPVLPRGGAP